ncbi:MAG: type II toxin-antitoxin system HicA family toxin [Moorea sp. SIO2B7]|nr:type II toxin-antitoxin system HicA family toxin [Moorena sp. SIO2B7]
MPKKIRELKQILGQAEFNCSPGKGSHTKWSHPLLPGKLTLSAKDKTDALLYQERDINNALQRIEKIRQREEKEQL